MLARLCAVGMAATLVFWGAPPARAAALPTISDITLSTHHVTVSGLGVANVVVEARIVAPDGQGHGVPDEMFGPYPHYPLVRLGKDEPVFYLPSVDMRSMALISGTELDGRWRATIRVPATYHGTWAAEVCAQEPVIDEAAVVCVDPESEGGDGSLVVTGSDQPRLRVLRLPTRAGGDRLLGPVVVRAFLRDSNRPIAGWVLVLCLTWNCVEPDPPVGRRVRTDAHGIARFPMESYQDFPNEVWLLAFPAAKLEHNVAYQAISVNPPDKFRLSARITPTAIRLGSTATISGSLGLREIAGYGRIVIQKWVSRAWVTVGYARVRESGRWSFTLTPTRTGSHVYRAWKRSAFCDGYRCLIHGIKRGPLTLTVR